MKDKDEQPILVKCRCCGAMVEMFPTHPNYQLEKARQIIEGQRLAHPEILEEE